MGHPICVYNPVQGCRSPRDLPSSSSALCQTDPEPSALLTHSALRPLPISQPSFRCSLTTIFLCTELPRLHCRGEDFLTPSAHCSPAPAPPASPTCSACRAAARRSPGSAGAQSCSAPSPEGRSAPRVDTHQPEVLAGELREPQVEGQGGHAERHVPVG